MTIFEEDSEDYGEETTLQVQKPLIGPWALQVLVVENLLHIPSLSWVLTCELTKISHLTFNRMRLVSNVLWLNSFHLVEIGANDEFKLLNCYIYVGEFEWGCFFKVLRKYFFIEGYWEWVEDVLSWHGKLLKSSNFMTLSLHLCSFKTIMPSLS